MLSAIKFYLQPNWGIPRAIWGFSPDGTIEIKGWDGTNSDPSSNFYVYKIIGVRINDEIVIKTGTIFLIE